MLHLQCLAQENLLTDPPFSQMDLVSCRNLLIYLEQHLQRKILPTFHYALKPGGFLFLGESESTGSLADLFETVSQTWQMTTVPLPNRLVKPGESWSSRIPWLVSTGMGCARRRP